MIQPPGCCEGRVVGELIAFPLRPRAGSPVMAEFLFDLADPFTYLVAERVELAFATATWTPVTGLRAADASVAARAEARARAMRLPLVWPERWPAAVPSAMRVALHAGATGRGGAFVLAASRLAFAGGYDLEDPEVLAEAAAAAGLSPELALAAAGAPELDPGRTARAEHLPAVRLGGALYAGEACLARALSASRAAGSR